MSALPKPRMSEAEYLAFERASPERHEFVDGEVYLMTGGTFRHARISGSLETALRNALRGKPCQPIGRDLRVKPQTGASYFYPDVLVYCGEPRLLDGHHDTLTNPVVIFEVLSDSTEKWDRGGKFLRYREFDTLQEYVLVAQDEALIEHYRRTPEGWLLTEHRGLDAALPLPALELALPLAEVYDGVTFPAPAEAAGPDRAA